MAAPATTPAPAPVSMPAPLLLQLAQRVHEPRYEALPMEVVNRAKALMVDSLGCVFGGLHTPVARRVQAVAASLGGAPQASAFGLGLQTSMPLAALLNGTALRVLDANDYVFARDPAHPSGSLAGLWAVGEAVGASGRELITAMVAAYELHLRLCTHAGAPSLWSRGWHHSNHLVLAAAAACARLLGCDVAATAQAMAIAGSHQNTLAQLQSGAVSQIKATAEAWAVKAAIEAALLARAGLTGPLDLLEGRHGWVQGVAGGLNTEALTQPFSGRFRLMDACIKPWPAVASAMAVIESGRRLHAQGLRAADIGQVVVALPSYVLGTPAAGSDRRHPRSTESAEHSLYWCAAVALVDGDCSHAQFEATRLQDPALHALLDRVTLQPDEALSRQWPAAAGAAMTVETRDGRVWAERCPFPPGHPSNALDAPALEHKFREHAEPAIGAAAAGRVLEVIHSLERQGHCGAVAQALS